MYPPLGLGVVEHSAFFSDPFGRIYRSIPQIWATLLALDGPARGRHIRDLHRGIAGVDQHGARYHALDPNTFWWAHATFTWMMFQSIDLFYSGCLDDDQRASLYQQTVAWYGLYGVSMRPVPPDYQAFCVRFDQICAAELELTPAAESAIALAISGEGQLPLVPERLIVPVRPVLGPIGRTIAFGCLPPRVRQRFAVPWSPADGARFRLLCACLRRGFDLVPDRANRATLQLALRRLGSRTRSERYIPAA
jgi:uncharacterized protein (DUF2236 family)